MTGWPWGEPTSREGCREASSAPFEGDVLPARGGQRGKELLGVKGSCPSCRALCEMLGTLRSIRGTGGARPWGSPSVDTLRGVGDGGSGQGKQTWNKEAAKIVSAVESAGKKVKRSLPTSTTSSFLERLLRCNYSLENRQA